MLKQWIVLEQEFLLTLLRLLSWLPSNQPLGPLAVSHPLTEPSLAVAKRILPKEDIAPSPTPLTPILGNTALPPRLDDCRFIRLLHCGTDHLYYFVNKKEPLLYDIIRVTWEQEWGSWQYRQLFSFLQSCTCERPPLKDITMFEKLPE